jgi:hypothetical protein
MRIIVAAGCLVLTASGCQGPPAQRTPRAADKHSLFGDPTLVPTRDGEAARRELAQSGELTRAIAATDWIDDVRVDVEHELARVRVLVAGRRSSTAPSDLDAQLRATAAAVCGADAELVLVLAEPHPQAPARRLDLPLGLALFGLGASLALVLDRGWRRRLAASRAATRRGGSRART